MMQMIAVALLLAWNVTGNPISHTILTVRGAKCDVVSADLRDPAVEFAVQLSRGGIGTDEVFESMATRPGNIAAVNGAYFALETKKPIGDLYFDGRLQSKGLMGTAMGQRLDGQLTMFRVPRNHGVDWSSYRTVFANGPALVLNGRVDCDPSGEGFDDGLIFPPNKRTAVGYTRNGKMMFVMCWEKVTLSQMANIMLDLGCEAALNLDAGSSLGFWYRGQIIRKPSRLLTNILVFRTK